MVLVPVHPDEQKFVDTALELVKSAGRLVRDAFDQPVCIVKTKASATDLVTETDQAVEKLLIDGLSSAFPHHKFIGEESTANGATIEWTDAPTWIIDPIDGTTNFVHRIPLVAICVGLAINKQLRAGIVYNPVTRELYLAQVGCGAFKNGFPIHVSTTTELNRSLITASMGIHNLPLFGESWLDIAQSNMRRQVQAGVRGIIPLLLDPSARLTDLDTTLEIDVLRGQVILLDSASPHFRLCSTVSDSVVITQLGSHRHPEMLHSFTTSYRTLMVDQNCHGHRAFGSAALNMMMVAQGACDAMVEYGIHAWDVAAAAVIVSEAGGCIIDPTGKPFNVMARKVLCAGTEELAMSLSRIMTHADFEPEG
ncbi:hypothetical protein RB195_004524 [Necator americanus]|uniref:Inositol-1-monophosphatase n=1 Tax=Necator americanus TaxID=51031 RepID=A0ABR1BLU0_NECAM